MRRFLSLLVLLPVCCFGQGFSDASAPFLLSLSSLRKGLAGYWRLEESTGTRYDRSPYGNHLTQSGGVGVYAGKQGYGASLTNTASQYLFCASSPSLTNYTSFSCAAWVQLRTLPTAGNYYWIAGKRNALAAGAEWQLAYQQQGGFGFGFGVISTTGVLSNLNSAVLASTNTWYHVAGVYDASAQEMRFYVNGFTRFSSPFTNAVGRSNHVFRIGAVQAAPTLFWNGIIDECGFWNRALTHDEVFQLYSMGNGATHPFIPSVNTYPWKIMADCPEAKEQHGFEELGGKLYAVAGIGSYNTDTNTVFCYDPNANSWATKAVYPISVQSLVLRAVGSKLYGIGGLAVGGVVTNVYEYDPSADTWTGKAPLPVPEEDMGSAVIGGKIYVAGGTPTGTNALQVYDPALNSWNTNVLWLPHPVCLGDMGCTDGTNFFLFGGSTNMTTYPTLQASTQVLLYNVSSNTWTTNSGVMPAAVCYKEPEYINGSMYMFSGAVLTNTTFTNLVLKYNVASDTWTQGTALPYYVRAASAAQYNGKIYISGGYGTDGTGSTVSWRRRLLRYDPE